MTALTDMELARATAGSDYATALSNLRAKYIALAAYDRALANKNVGMGGDATKIPVFTFNGSIAAMPAELLHPEYAADALTGIEDAVEAQVATNLGTLGQ